MKYLPLITYVIVLVQIFTVLIVYTQPNAYLRSHKEKLLEALYGALGGILGIGLIVIAVKLFLLCLEIAFVGG